MTAQFVSFHAIFKLIHAEQELYNTTIQTEHPENNRFTKPADLPPRTRQTSFRMRSSPKELAQT